MNGDLASVAEDAVAAAAPYLRERFAAGETDAEYTETDVKAAADRGAERRVLAAIRDARPADAISAEESGDHPGDGDVRWLVDPLDGTNNFAIGDPTFGVAVTAVDDRGPAATAVAVPALDETYVARRGGGVEYEGTAVEATDGRTLPLARGTVGLIIGKPVIHGEAEGRAWERISASVDDACKRAIRSWAPVVHWGLLARGRIEGFVCFHPEEREQAAGELLAAESGCHLRGDGPLTVVGATESIRDELWTAAATAR